MNSLFFKGSFVFGCKSKYYFKMQCNVYKIFQQKYRLRKRLS